METNKHHPEQDTSLSPSPMSSRSLCQHSSESIFLSESPPSPPCADCIHDRSLPQEWGTDTTVLTHLAFPLYNPMLAFPDAEGFDSGEGVRCADVSLARLLNNHLRRTCVSRSGYTRRGRSFNVPPTRIRGYQAFPPWAARLKYWIHIHSLRLAGFANDHQADSSLFHIFESTISPPSNA